MGILIGLAALGFVVGVAGIDSAIKANEEAADTAEDALTLEEDEFDYQKEQDLQQEREDIVAQANSAAMNIDPLEQSIREATYWKGHYASLAEQIAIEREDSLSMYDTQAKKTLSTQKVRQALSGAKVDVGTAAAVTEETVSGLATDRSNLKRQYDTEISNQMDTSNFYADAIEGYNEDIAEYNTLITDIYNANSDWLTEDNINDYGGQFDSWLM